MSARFPDLRVPLGTSQWGGQRYAKATIVERRRTNRIQRYLQWWSTNGVRKVYIGSVPYDAMSIDTPATALQKSSRRKAELDPALERRGRRRRA